MVPSDINNYSSLFFGDHHIRHADAAWFDHLRNLETCLGETILYSERPGSALSGSSISDIQALTGDATASQDTIWHEDQTPSRFEDTADFRQSRRIDDEIGGESRDNCRETRV